MSPAADFAVNGATALRIDAVTPPAGRASGGQLVKLTGSFAGLSSVKVGGAPATWSYTNGTGEITLTTPAHDVGAVSVELVPASGEQYAKPNAFAYLPTVFTDDTLVAGVTPARAQHVTELRQAVDALRAVAGLGPAPWSGPPPQSLTGAVITAAHVADLRAFLEDAAARLGYPPQTYEDPDLGAVRTVKRIHIEQLRQRVRLIAG